MSTMDRRGAEKDAKAPVFFHPGAMPVMSITLGACLRCRGRKELGLGAAFKIACPRN